MRLGLRAKSALALGLCIAIVLALAVLAGRRALGTVEENLGTAFARNVTRYNKQRILAPVARELALSQRLAGSEVTRRWLLDETNPDKKALFFAEAEGYRHDFVDHSYFVISGLTHHYYFNDKHSKYSDSARYSLHANDPNDAWFFNTLKKSTDYNINIDFDVKLKVTKVWFNVLVKDGKRNLGLAGTGLDLTTFLNRFINSAETGVTPILLNRAGMIQAHPDRKLIDYSSINDKGANHSSIDRLLSSPRDIERMRDALRRSAAKPDAIEVLWANLGGKRCLFSISFIPEMNWYVLTAVDLKAAGVIDTSVWKPFIAGTGLLLLVLVLCIVIAADRIFLTPLLKLTTAVRALGAGNYEMELPPAGNDELGELTRSFGVMAAQVRSHTEQLETKVSERTQELVSVNQQMSAANKKIGDSIQYASLIQNAILPARELERTLAGKHFVLWRPRDVVGGDFYVYRTSDRGCLLGVVDCAGHGVPGALMTMVAQTSIDVAADTLGLNDPAAILKQVDTRIRAVLPPTIEGAQSASQMDAGLMYVDFQDNTITFAGAKVSLYLCDGARVEEIKGDRYAIGGKRMAVFTNRSAPLDAGTTYYLTTDGLLDQAGGPKGLSLGGDRFATLLRENVGRPFAEQQEAFDRALADYQGTLPQRDDITLMGFRITGPGNGEAGDGHRGETVKVTE